MTLPTPYEGPRLLRPSEARASHRLSQACFGEFSGAEPEDDAPVLETGQPSGDEPESGETHVIAYEGVPVSQISIFYTPLRVYESVVGVGSIGGVCTLPEQRGHGLAMVLLDHCAQQLVEMGASLMLISGGRGLYRRAGCVPTGSFAEFSLQGAGGNYTVETGKTLETQSGLRLRAANAADAPAAARLYQAEPVHFMRPLESFMERFSRARSSKHAEQWMLERGGRVVGYLLLDNPWEYAGRPEAGIREVDEYAGSRTALAEAACAVVEQGGIRALRFGVPWQDGELLDLLGQRKGSPAPVPLDSHTMRLLDFAALMTGLHDYMRARLPADLLRGLSFEQDGGLIVAGDVFGKPMPGAGPGRCAITRGADRLELSTAEMTLLVMGDPEDQLQVNPPGALREIVDALFPLPAFLPGLDYH